MSKNKVYKKGFKGFNAGLKCLDKQYTENTVFKENGGGICGAGVMHFCEVPMAVLSYYPFFQICNDEVICNEFAQVEALADCQQDGDKLATSKLKIGAKINFAGLCTAQIEYVKEKTEKAATTGNEAHSATTGWKAHSATTGWKAHSATTGNEAHSATTGKNSIAAALGRDGGAKAAKGSWIVLAEYNNTGNILCVKAAQIDGETLKPNTFYKLKNGEFVEADNE